MMNEVSEICVTRTTIMRDALLMLDRSGAGLLLLTDQAGAFERTVTDGDLRRLLLGGVDMAVLREAPEAHDDERPPRRLEEP